MVKTEAQGVLKQLLSIERHAESLIGLIGVFDEREKETNSVLTEYEDARNSFAAIARKENVDAHLRKILLAPKWDSDNNKALLREIHIECEKGIEVMQSIVVLIPKEELDKLNSLREQLEKLTGELDDINYEKNVTKAIDEYVAGHTLASALVSSRVIIYALDKIPGKDAEDKVKFLDEKKIIDKKGKDPSEFILKANKKARNFFSHDIKAFPDPSDAHSLLGDAIAILRIIAKLEEASKSQAHAKE